MTSPASLPSTFELLIDDLFARDDRPAGAPRPNPFSIDSLAAAWTLRPNIHGGVGEREARSREIYASETDFEEKSSDEILLDPNKILLELGLNSEVSEADIAALRREFALRNHPDRVQPELRALATQRMMIANDLMDRYVARLRKGVR